MKGRNVAQQNVEFNIGANVTGMEAIASLINKTDALGKSQQNLATAFEKMSGAAQKASDVQKAAMQIEAARIEVSSRAAQAYFDNVHAIERVSKSAKDSASVFEEMFRQQDQVVAAQREAAASADALRAKLDPMVPLQRQFNAAMDQADNLLSMGAISQREYAQAVELARQNLQQQTAALHAVSGASSGVVVNGVRYNNMLDAQAKQLRNARQGTQQLGMQINDFATSVSTGSSPLQAFNQQIGQVGYAMSMMGGTAGKIGTFLAGPWGAAITFATMGLGFLVTKLFETDESADKAADKIKDLGDQFDFAAMNGEQLTRVNELLANANKQVAATAIQAANATAAKAAADANAAQQALNLARGELAKRKATLASMREPTAFAGGGVPGAAFTAGQFAVNRQNKAIEDQIKVVEGLDKAYEGFQFRSRQFSAESYSLTAALDGSARAAEAHNAKINNLRNDYAAGRINIQEYTRAVDAETAAYNKQKEAAEKTKKSSRKSGADAGREYRKAAEEEIRRLNKTTDEIFKQLKPFGDRAAEFFKPRDKNAPLQITTDLAKDFAPTLKTMEEMRPLNKELQQSFENIGMSVSNAFKGMLTGAMSWKDGMKSIIGSVIDELFRLYVVQQIVGFITSGLEKIGLPLPRVKGARANGGNVSGNRPYLVGENGPELMVPGGSGTIIPNRNLGMASSGSGMTINVDARGANDPAAVRAQVQQGILEAAPAIIAAAEARTVQGMRRPRLGGAMQ